MTFDQIICSAMAPMNVPVAELVYRGNEEEYMTYNLIAERGIEHADDGAQYLAAEYHLHYYGRGNPQPKKRAIRRLLASDERFYILNAEVLYDASEQEYYHIVFDVDILNDADDGVEEGEQDAV